MRRLTGFPSISCLLATVFLSGSSAHGQTEAQAFVDEQSAQTAGWSFNDEGQNPARECTDCATDLGWKPTNIAGGAAAGEGGGSLHRSGTLPVGFYGDIAIGELTLDMRISATGKVGLVNRDFDGEMHLGFFDSVRLLEDPSDLGANMGFIIAEPGGNVAPNFRWGPIVRTDNGLGDRNNLSFTNGLPDSTSIDFSIVYEPADNGLLTLTIGDEEPVVRELTAEERADGATFTAFGIHTGTLINSADARSAQILIDDVAYTSLLSDITPGDFNGDGSIDTQDYSILVSNFNTVDKTFEDGDADFNGVVDLGDFVVFRDIFAGAGGGQVASVPEPRSQWISLLGLLAVALSARCTRRQET